VAGAVRLSVVPWDELLPGASTDAYPHPLALTALAGADSALRAMPDRPTHHVRQRLSGVRPGSTKPRRGLYQVTSMTASC